MKVLITVVIGLLVVGCSSTAPTGKFKDYFECLIFDHVDINNEPHEISLKFFKSTVPLFYIGRGDKTAAALGRADCSIQD